MGDWLVGFKWQFIIGGALWGFGMGLSHVNAHWARSTAVCLGYLGGFVVWAER